MFRFALPILVACFGVIVGTLMLISPYQSRRFLAWWSRADEWSYPGPRKAPRGWELDTRLAGAALASMGVLLIRIIVRRFARPGGGAQPKAPPIAPPAPALAFYTAAIPGLLVTAAGAWALLVRPETITQKFASSWPERTIPEASLHRVVMMTRVIGVLLVLGGASALWLGIRNAGP